MKQKPVLVLVWILLVSIVSLVPNYATDKYLTNTIDESVVLEANSISESQEGPTMRYYLR